MRPQIGEMVYSRVYGYAVVTQYMDREHVIVSTQDKEELVIHLSGLMKVGLA